MEEPIASSVALRMLCRHYGIAIEYQDVAGHRHMASDETLAALLSEFGVAANTPEQCIASLEQSETLKWFNLLPPVVTIDSGNPSWHFKLHLPQEKIQTPQTPLVWKIIEENGATHNGIFNFGDLPIVASTELNGASWYEYQVELAISLPAGYHYLYIDQHAESLLIVAAPRHCHIPPVLSGNGRIWGVSLQLYALRSMRNWGIGDFTDLMQAALQWSERGADIVGVNPLHSLFPHNPAHLSPYSPSSRLGLNVLYIDVEASNDFRDCQEARHQVQSPEFQARLLQLRESELVDYPGVAAAKFEILQQLYQHFRAHHRHQQTEYGCLFRAFLTQGGETLRGQVVFEALQAHFHAADVTIWGWPVWPESYRNSNSTAVKQFAEEHIERVEWFAYLQWQAQMQLTNADAHCRSQGMAVGLYIDLAVSVDRGGADAWMQSTVFAPKASIGAPPDAFNLLGQNWCLPPLQPDRLRDQRYGMFIETLRASMRNAGALRIDHVMGLMRLYWIPSNKNAKEGAYVHYPLQELLAIVALESERNRCMVIGEDLGTVADELRTALAQYGLLSYKLLYFERSDSGEFKLPVEYAQNALVTVSTHDLATLAGWWSGRDLLVRQDLGLYPDTSDYERKLAERAQDHVRLMFALQRAGLLPENEPLTASQLPKLTPQLAEAIQVFIARTPARVMMVQIEDAIGVIEQANIPATIDEHPNWRRKLPQTLEQMTQDGRISNLAQALARERPRRALQASLSSSNAQDIDINIPRATYRLQLHHDFDFDAATAIVPYLAKLGISHVYCSPILRARPGSMHGYDIVDYSEINPELGGWAAFERFNATLRKYGLGLLLDMVPNHMGIFGADNPWWMDVLENGPASRYAGYFDIDWNPVNPELIGKILMPVLGNHYGDALMDEALVLSLEADNGTLVIHYHEHRFPLDPRTYPMVLSHAAGLAIDTDTRATLSLLIVAFNQLPVCENCTAAMIEERAIGKERHKASLIRFLAEQPAVGQAIQAAITEINTSRRHDAMHELLDAQAYRLAFWRVAPDEINYRRFFDINDLAAMRMENEQVFEATHGFILDLAAAGIVDGLRIDHPDGLRDPAQYLQRLQQGYARRIAAMGNSAKPSLYVVIEKITALHEKLPDSWQCHGTTGYRFANAVNGILIDVSARARFDRIWRMFTRDGQSFNEIAYRGKRDVAQSIFAAELARLATELWRIAQSDRRTRDYPFNTLRRALVEITACLPIYRTYIVKSASKQDVRYIDWAVGQARQRSRDIDSSVFNFVRQTLLGQTVEDSRAVLADQAIGFAMRFQQFSSPVAAKGVEDTAFYRYQRLASLNEVGGDPALFGITLRAFHNANRDRALHSPHTMLATSTHDNKRSEDVRHRINVLTENPAAWRLVLRRWSAMNRRYRSKIGNNFAPSAADEYLLYQTLISTCPTGEIDDSMLAIWRKRIDAYMSKAAHEAKLHTSWVNPNTEYDAALGTFIDVLLKRVEPNPFLDDLRRQTAVFAWFGGLNSLTMALLKFTAPGVPDIYQGNELIDLSLVDPDNRRPVDYAKRKYYLNEIVSSSTFTPTPASIYDGRAKLWLTWHLLDLRRRLPELFRNGDYQALSAYGVRSNHIIAYARNYNDVTLLVAGCRFYSSLSDVPDQLPLGYSIWSDTAIEVPFIDGTKLRNVFSGETLTVFGGRISVGLIFRNCPAAALVSVGREA